MLLIGQWENKYVKLEHVPTDPDGYISQTMLFVHGTTKSVKTSSYYPLSARDLAKSVLISESWHYDSIPAADWRKKLGSCEQGSAPQLRSSSPHHSYFYRGVSFHFE